MRLSLLTCLFVFLRTGGFCQSPAIQWQRCLGGSGIEVLSSIAPAPDGGCAMAGYTTSSDGDVTNYLGNWDMWVTRLSGDGTLLWAKCLGTATGTEDAYSIAATSDGGFVVVGYQEIGDSTVLMPMNYYIVKLNDTGGVQWSKNYGGFFSDMPQSVQQTYDGGYIVAGISESHDGDVLCGTWDSVALYNNPWILKLDTAGNIQWQTCIHDTSMLDNLYRIVQTPDSGYAMAGYFRNACVIKLSKTGSVEWKRDSLPAADIRATYDGGFVVAAGWQLAKLNDTGGVQWIKSVGDSTLDYVSSVWQTTDSGYVLGGTTSNSSLPNYHADGDALVKRTDKNGNLLWQTCAGGSQQENGMGIIQSTDGRYIIACSTNSSDGDVTSYHANGDYWAVKFATNLSVVPISAPPTIGVHPNPGSGIYYLSGVVSAHIMVWDMMGQLLVNEPHGTSFSLVGYPSGPYIVRLFDTEGTCNYFGKIIKE